MKRSNKISEFMSGTEYKAYSLSNPNECDRLEFDVCTALLNGVSGADICDKYNIARHVLTFIKENNGLLIKASASDSDSKFFKIFTARKAYERQCKAIDKEPLPVKDWRVIHETKDDAEGDASETKELDNDSESPFSPKEMAKIFKGKPAVDQPPLNLLELPDDSYEQSIEITKRGLEFKFLHMILLNSRLRVVLNSLAEELYGNNSGKLVIEYKNGKPTNTVITYKDENA